MGNGDLAIAVNGGDATAGGFQSMAFADGANSDAQALGIGDIASIFNTGSGLDQAIAGGTSCPFSDNDLAFIFGTDSTARPGWRHLGHRRRLRRHAPRDRRPAAISCSTYCRRCRVSQGLARHDYTTAGLIIERTRNMNHC